jgi:hypothetical protein
MVLGRSGQSWEDPLLAQIDRDPRTAATTSTSVVDLLVAVELEAPSLVVVGEQFPRLPEALSRLRSQTRVVIVGAGPSADTDPGRADLESLLGYLAIAPHVLGRVTTVWGPPGSWGTTSVAIGLARSLSRTDPTLLIDGNVHAPSIGDLLNVALGGLMRACLSADRGTPQLDSQVVSKRFSVLSGIDPAVYPAVHPGALQQVLDAASRDFRHVLLDVDSAVDAAGEIGLVPDWTTATAVGLRAADHVVIVVGDTDCAQQRLWRSLPAVADVLRGRATVVVNRCADPRRTTAKLASRLGDFLPEAALGWISGPITEASLRHIVAEVAAQVPTGES